MRYVIIPLVIILYIYIWYKVIINFKEDWKPNTPIEGYRKDFLCFHVLFLVVGIILCLICLIAEYW